MPLCQLGLTLRRQKQTGMKEDDIHLIYKSVCDAPSDNSLHVDHMPAFFTYDTADNSLPHVHSFYEILWFQKAGGTHTVDFRNYEIEENSMFFLSPGQVHFFDGKTPHEGVLIKFCTDFLKDERGEDDIFIKYGVFNAFDTGACCTINNPVVVTRLKHIVAQMEEELKNASSFGQIDMLRSLVKMFLINVYRHGEKKGVKHLDAMKPSHRLFVLFRQLVEMEYGNLHTVKDYANRLNVSVKTLTNSISECSGKTALAFINDRILLEAKRFLGYTDLRVNEISSRLGFEDPSYFVKFFKRKTALVPSDFREMSKRKP